MKVYSGHLIPPQDLLDQILKHQTDYRELLNNFKQIEEQWFQDVENLPLPHQYSYLTLRNGIGYAKAWLEWCDEVITFLKGQIGKQPSI